MSPGVTFVGRLATYRYIDMDVAVAEALSAARTVVEALNAGIRPPAIFHAAGASQS
jgi:UDP-galactopyranose mutase